jgi:hypothetical protein
MSDFSKTQASSPRSKSRPGKGTEPGGTPAEEGTTPSQGIGEQAAQAARDLKDKASQTAKELVSQAGARLRTSAEDQKAAGADRVSGIADAIRRTADGLEGELPQAAQYVRRAATELQNVSDAVRRRDVTEVVRGVQDFARRQPTAFLGAAVLAGFVAVRFLKTSSQHSADSSTDADSHSARGGAEDQGGRREAFEPRVSNGDYPSAMSPGASGYSPQPAGPGSGTP